MFNELARKAAEKKAAAAASAASSSRPQGQSLYVSRSAAQRTADSDSTPKCEQQSDDESRKRPRVDTAEDNVPAAPAAETVDWAAERETFLREKLQNCCSLEVSRSAEVGAAIAASLAGDLARWMCSALLANVTGCESLTDDEVRLKMLLAPVAVGPVSKHVACIGKLWFWLSVWKRHVLHRHLSVEVLQILRAAKRGGPSSYDVVDSYKKVMELLNAERQLENMSRLLAVDALTIAGLLPADSQRCVPESFVGNLDKMFTQIDSREYLPAENTYLEMAIGTGQWHLGLCNGGDVHMRKNMAKLQRGNVTHILNNDGAMKILHTIKRIITLAQKPEMF
jgi:hypothetical protein